MSRASKLLISTVAISALCVVVWACVEFIPRTRYSEPKVEGGVILETAYEPSTLQRHTRMVPTTRPKPGGGVSHGWRVDHYTTGHSERFATVFRCEHDSVFTITDKRTFSICSGRDNERVLITYRDVFDVWDEGEPTERREFVDFEFLSAELAPKEVEGR